MILTSSRAVQILAAFSPKNVVRQMNTALLIQIAEMNLVCVSVNGLACYGFDKMMEDDTVTYIEGVPCQMLIICLVIP